MGTGTPTTAPAINMAASGALKAAFRAHLCLEMSIAELEAIDCTIYFAMVR